MDPEQHHCICCHLQNYSLDIFPEPNRVNHLWFRREWSRQRSNNLRYLLFISDKCQNAFRQIMLRIRTSGSWIKISRNNKFLERFIKLTKNNQTKNTESDQLRDKWHLLRYLLHNSSVKTIVTGWKISVRPANANNVRWYLWSLTISSKLHFSSFILQLNREPIVVTHLSYSALTKQFSKQFSQNNLYLSGFLGLQSSLKIQT